MNNHTWTNKIMSVDNNDNNPFFRVKIIEWDMNINGENRKRY